jgi:hypothetical protein
MFRNLKKRLEQGVAQTPLKGALSAVTKVCVNIYKDYKLLLCIRV